MKSRSSTLAFPIASITIVLCWLPFVLSFHNPASQALFAVGNVIVGVGILLLYSQWLLGEDRGIPKREETNATTLVVTGGVYSIVRHPLYLGWLLMYPAAALASQQWLIVIWAVMGIASMDQITRNADQELVERFGVDYETHIQPVPRLNIASGTVRKLKRRG